MILMGLFQLRTVRVVFSVPRHRLVLTVLQGPSMEEMENPGNTSALSPINSNLQENKCNFLFLQLSGSVNLQLGKQSKSHSEQKTPLLCCVWTQGSQCLGSVTWAEEQGTMNSRCAEMNLCLETSRERQSSHVLNESF